MNRLVPSSKVPVDINLAYPSDSMVSANVASAGDLWRILWRRRIMILATIAVLLACALAYCLVAQPRYTASVELFIDPRDRQVLANDVNPSSIASDGGIAQVGVIGSSAVLLRAIAATHLPEQLEGQPGGPLARLRAFIGSEDRPASPEAAQSRALRWLRARVSIKRADRVPL